MNQQKTIAPVRHAVTVPLSPERAFALFTEGYNSWWPGHHIGKADLAEAVLEPRTGGRYYERDVDGSECEWGKVLVCEPPHRIVVAWQINEQSGAWVYDPTCHEQASSRSGSSPNQTARPASSSSTATSIGMQMERQGYTRAYPGLAAGPAYSTAMRRPLRPHEAPGTPP